MTLQSSASKSNSLSNYEVQALIGFPTFRNLDRHEVASALSKILHTSTENLLRMNALDGSDTQNVSVCLLSHLNEWADGLEVGATPNGGQQQMRNVRLCELASGKSDKGGRKADRNGILLPCLEDFGFSICCAMVPGPMGRKWSFFRLCYTDEVPRKGDKKSPYVPPIKAQDDKKPARSARRIVTVPRQSSHGAHSDTLAPTGANPTANLQQGIPPQQQSMFSEQFLSWETGAADPRKGRRA